MNGLQVQSPVVFFIFNRPETTKLVFSQIEKARPKKLLLISDGARASRINEIELVNEARKIAQNVTWDCEVLANFSKENLGCKRRISSGLDWAFEQVSEAIILEDDCLPSDSFFQFCDEMLDRYRGDKSIGMIGGINFQAPQVRKAADYYFSKYTHIWGWATWADRWVGTYDVDMMRWPKVKVDQALKNTLSSARELKYWEAIFDRVHDNQIDTWDYQWVFANWMSSRLNILPSTNLISNIGFGSDATHTKGYSELANLPAEDLVFPLRHPDEIKVNVAADQYTDRLCFRRPLYKRLLGKLGQFVDITKLGLMK
ncbi:glycosyltransferase family 2 protein [Polynucleobacter paneuropaeus]|jgi:hypothetical protein|uniref:Glycosyltransferase family 2 protein n=1 Tax=Polynucleobacter paneuropaeus TaxID=2527775 RepID=A0AAE2YLQ2_9BURK|nr:glycosyltransferase family 2 protein [Polynucleobacter paneuropaeus]MBT8591843.1 glycosyltransferase family 2 protein [Polynucleobacter paneuropaeus]MBT8597234.1 glycosyltransferase family 2 protein [Polynucleobacter paneuropaeus]MBT8599047.1 glycosyltransferase family 2 protein [Polynucleobacter paneuropaeus]